jgi:hypothetical protein
MNNGIDELYVIIAEVLIIFYWNILTKTEIGLWCTLVERWISGESMIVQ